MLQQIIQNANSRPELRKYRKTLPDWAQKTLSLKDVLFSFVAPYRSAQAERLTLFTLLDGEPPILLAALSGGAKSSAWLIKPVGNMSLCASREAFTLRDINANGQREFAWVYGCGDGPGGGDTLNIFEWQRGELRLTYETEVFLGFHADGTGFEKKTTVYVNKGPKPKIIGVVKGWEATYDYVGGKDVLRSSKEITVLRPVQTPVKDPSLTVTRLW